MPAPCVSSLEVIHSGRTLAARYNGRFTRPADELYGPITATGLRLITLRAVAAARDASPRSSPRTSTTRLPSTPPRLLAWRTASCAPRRMSTPFDDCGPLIGASTAITIGWFLADAAGAATRPRSARPASTDRRRQRSILGLP